MEDNRITIPIKASVVHFFKQTLKAFFISAVVALLFCTLISFFTTTITISPTWKYYNSMCYVRNEFGASVDVSCWRYEHLLTNGDKDFFYGDATYVYFDDMLKLLAEEEFIFAWFITFLILFGIWMFVLIVKTLRRNFRIQLTENENFNERRTSQNGGYTGGYNGGHNQQNTGYSSRSQNEEY